jgi:hypothetical protein
LKVGIVRAHFLNDLSECVQHSDSNRRLEIELTSSNPFGHLAIYIWDGVRYRSSKFAETVSLNYKREILIVRCPTNGFDKRGG